MTDEAWTTDEDLAAARRRFENRIPGWVPPAAHGTVLLRGDRPEVLVANSQARGGGALLPAAALALVLGRTSGTATWDVEPAALDEVLRLLAPALAAVHRPHPNTVAWRAVRDALHADPELRLQAVFVEDLADPVSSPSDAALRAALAS
jgi:hypothetical protein